MEMIVDIKNTQEQGQYNKQRTVEVFQQPTRTVQDGPPEGFRKGVIDSNNGRRCGNQEKSQHEFH
jgi:hypothetical protein